MGGDHVCGVQVQPALDLVAQRPQARCTLAVDVQLGGVLQAQHHGVSANTGQGGLVVRGQHVLAANLFVA